MSGISFKPTRQWTLNCRACGQRISKLLSGQIVNDENGKGGKRNDDHICPERLKTGAASSGDWKRIKTRFVCGRCSVKFMGLFVDCPFCFKLICQNCGHKQDWRIDKPQNTCNNCDHKYLDWTEVSIYVSDNEYRKKTKAELNWKPVIAQHVKQIFDCNRYGHIRRKGDKNCRVCNVGVIRDEFQ